MDAMGERGHKVRAMLRAKLGEDVYSSWFGSMEIESFEESTVRVSVPTTFLRHWIQSHYARDLLECCAAEFTGTERVDVLLRQPAPGGRMGNPALAEQAGRVSRPERTDARRL